MSSEDQAASPLEPEALEALVDAFVHVHSRNGIKQRGQEWKNAMGVSVGGSEIAAIMGVNPYMNFFDVVHGKLEALAGTVSFRGGESCWWGTLFEDVIGAYVEIDLGARVKGDEICIREIAGHRTSPDGYIVARFYDDGELRLWTTDLESARTSGLQAMILLLEFKCPISRLPKKTVPKQYQPQLWSGLAVSPVAHMGLYVDAVFRKCAMFDLGDAPEYDTAYHARDKEAWEAPVAWGLIGVYAPLLSAPRHVRLGWRGPEWTEGDPSPEAADADASQAAWQIHGLYFGLRLKTQKNNRDLVDLGDAEKKLFNRTLGLIDQRRFPVTRVAPCFVDGRGCDLRSSAGIASAVEELRRDTPESHWLFALLPWKLFEVAYVPVARQPGFLEEVRPLIDEVHRTVAEARASGDPLAFIKARRLEKYGPIKPCQAPIDGEALQDLFDSVSSRTGTQ